MPLSISFRSWSRFALALAAVSLAACASAPRTGLPWSNAQQLIVVTTANWDADHGRLRRFEKAPGESQWHEAGSVAPVMVGRAGSAWGIGLHPAQRSGPQKREGDGRAPAGVFALGTAFGYGERVATAWPYRGMDAGDYCIDVPDSPLYNRLVNTQEAGEQAVAGSTEPMRRDLHAGGDQRYRLGFVIEHNPHAQPGAGSCIFAHLWKQPGEPTSGCTAMSDVAMAQTLEWLDPQRRPVFVLLPEGEYRRLRAAWDLPVF